MLEVVAFVLLRYGCVLPCLAVTCTLVCCSPSNLRIFPRLQKCRALTWSACRGSPVHAFDSWLASQGWDRTAEW